MTEEQQLDAIAYQVSQWLDRGQRADDSLGEIHKILDDEAPANIGSIRQLRRVLDTLWAELPADVVLTLPPEVVDACRDNHEAVWHTSPH